MPVDIVNLQEKTEVTGELSTALDRAVTVALACVGLDPTGIEVSMALVDDDRIRELNCRFRGKDAPTDVLSFGMDDHEVPGEPAVLGDIVISLETASREAPEPGGLGRHAMVLAIHGLLHLLGYDHENDDDAREMEAREREILAVVAPGIPDAGKNGSGGS